MNDYKYLIEELRKGYVLHENYNGEPEIIHRPSPTDKEAADTIDQLVRERDAAVKCIEDIETYLQMGSAKYIDKTIKEWRGVRDADS